MATERDRMGNVAEVIDHAILPEKPIKPDKKTIVIAGTALGLGLGLGLLIIREYFDHSLHSVEEAALCFAGIKILGVIPELKPGK